MFGFKKKQCAVCQTTDVIHVGKPLGHLCEKHMLETYKAKFLAHQGRKIIIPPATPDKYTSYQFETIASLRSYGWDSGDVAPLQKLFSEFAMTECYVMQTSYKAQDILNMDQFETENWKQKSSHDALIFILSGLRAYMNSNGVALPPDENEDVILYPLRI